MKDLLLKRDIVLNGKDKLLRKYLFELHQSHIKDNHESIEMFENQIKYFDDDTMRVCYNLNQSRYRRIRSIRQFVLSNIVKYSSDNLIPIFATFTFDNDTLNSTSELARKKRIKRLIFNYCASAVLNVDFGKTNEREHYHAIILISRENISKMQKKAEKNGFVNFEPISNCSDIDICRLSKYLNKLVYHALKDTTHHLDGSYRCFYYTTFDK